MVEDKLDFIKIRGKAYETRHLFCGDMTTGNIISQNIDPWGYHRRDMTSVARIGSSGNFSNISGREGKTKVMRYPNMYTPLLRHFEYGFDPDQFMEHVDKLVRDEFSYISSRVRAAGILLSDTIKGECDMMWLPELENGFPKPVIIEYKI
jgi:hypothetical protein